MVDFAKLSAKKRAEREAQRVASERASSEPEGPAKVVGSVATGSLPVSSAEVCFIASQLERRAAQCAAESGQPDWQHPGDTRESLKRDELVLKFCARLLRHAVEATVRQPEGNAEGQRTARTDVRTNL